MKSNPVLEAILNRRSVRKYSPEALRPEQIRSILEAGRWAPSGKNLQPWRFVVVGDSGLKEKLSRLTRYGPVVAQAGAVIAVFLDHDSSYDRLKDLQAIGACIQNMLLAAHSLGLGACWQGEILGQREEVERLLEVPPAYELMALVTVGLPEGAGKRSSRRRLEELAWWERYGQNLPPESGDE
jgi:nitroreductase